eukprot:scaffold36689_cov199-Amphora_coffeaeformis.AAC.2
MIVPRHPQSQRQPVDWRCQRGWNEHFGALPSWKIDSTLFGYNALLPCLVDGTKKCRYGCIIHIEHQRQHLVTDEWCTLWTLNGRPARTP